MDCGRYLDLEGQYTPVSCNVQHHSQKIQYETQVIKEESNEARFSDRKFVQINQGPEKINDAAQRQLVNQQLSQIEENCLLFNCLLF